MSIKTILQKAAKTVFKVFSSLVKNSVYTVHADDGFDTIVLTNYTPLPVLPISLERDDLNKLSFSDIIQPTDVVCLICGVDLQAHSIVIKQNDTITFDSVTYTIVEFDTDSASALYTCLLRVV